MYLYYNHLARLLSDNRDWPGSLETPKVLLYTMKAMCDGQLANVTAGKNLEGRIDVHINSDVCLRLISNLALVMIANMTKINAKYL